jgi:hypothetical protein
MYRMTASQAIGLDPEYGPTAPSSVPVNLAAQYQEAEGRPVASVIGPVYPAPITIPPASTGPAAVPPSTGPAGPAPPTLAVPPGTYPIPGDDIATPPVAPPSLPGDVVGPALPNGPPPSRPGPGSPTGWWGQQTATTQAALVVGGAAALGALAWLVFKGKPMRPNRAAAPRRADGEVITLPGGQRWGHTIPPKEYRAKGATRKSDYAWPDGYKYPLVFRRSDGTVDVGKSRAHVRSAASYFARYKDNYPPRVRREIAKNINKAKKRFDVGGKPATP